VSLSARNDLISNTLTPAVPSSITIKLLATTGGACNAAVPGNLASGLRAWGTTIHGQTTSSQITKPNTSDYCVTYCSPGEEQWPTYCKLVCKPVTTTTSTTTYSTTETEFSWAALSATELARISDRCQDIQENGSGYGICRSCRAGGQ
jgi:hypothetical protein